VSVRAPHRPAAPSAPAGRGLGAVLLLGTAVGSAVYAIAVSVMARWPSIVRERGSGGAARPVLVAAVAVPLAVAGLVLLVRARAWATPGARARAFAAVACVGFGGAWVAWGLVEQHLLRSFDLAPGAAASGAWDALFHAAGLLVAGLGTALMSAEGSGRPSASAAGRQPTAATPGVRRQAT
jgi:hypothetical protein